jgi:hypothetical protein
MKFAISGANDSALQRELHSRSSKPGQLSLDSLSQFFSQRSPSLKRVMLDFLN